MRRKERKGGDLKGRRKMGPVVCGRHGGGLRARTDLLGQPCTKHGKVDIDIDVTRSFTHDTHGRGRTRQRVPRA